LTTVAVLGAGSWGTTLADLLAGKGHEVRLWAYEADVVASVNQRHRNEVYLPGCALAPALRAVADVGAAVDGADVVLCAAPSHAARSVLAVARAGARPGALLVSATKGMEIDTLSFMSQVAAETLPALRFVAMSGRSFAE
jgi:glycerol-3-phosphate dehydrogenase (NAD(P)+)